MAGRVRWGTDIFSQTARKDVRPLYRRTFYGVGGDGGVIGQPAFSLEKREKVAVPVGFTLAGSLDTPMPKQLPVY